MPPKRMQTLIDDLLSYSRIGTHSQPIISVNLNTIVQDVLLEFDLLIEQTNTQIEVKSLPTIDAEPIHMHQLFQNLIHNAIKISKRGYNPSYRDIY